MESHDPAFNATMCLCRGYVLPLACNDQRMSKLAEFIRLKSAEWSPMLILFNKLPGSL
jgi:methylglyoxal synthase